MNIQLILIASLVSAALAGWLGYDYGTSKIEADVARENRVAEIATNAAAKAAAEAISKQKVRTTVVRGEIEREIRTNVVYVDCKHAPEQLLRINEALTGDRPVTPGDRAVPKADAPD